MLNSARTLAPAVVKSERSSHILEYPPPMVHAEPDMAFMSNELLMHKALYSDLDPRFASNTDALAARRWTMSLYILWKRSISLREGVYKSTKDAGANGADSPLAVEEMPALVAEMRDKIEEGRDYYADFKDGVEVLARYRSPYFHAVKMWEVVERYLRESFEGESGLE